MTVEQKTFDSDSVKDLKQIASAEKRDWNHIFAAKEESARQKKEIIAAFQDQNLFSSDLDFVVFGSLARKECTKGSDLDWTLLIDGAGSSTHSDLAHLINTKLESIELQEPGSSGVFGQLTFSHDVINYIGGQDDTNHNTTRRILLLLESAKISLNPDGLVQASAYGRVCRAVLTQYLKNDSGFTSERTEYIPRFLLNDIIRFWRTMCVDFAYKQREQKGKKWALRNIKLRMSRKLIYVKGLLMCHSCSQINLEQDYDTNLQLLQGHLMDVIEQDTLNFVSSHLLEQGINQGYIIELLDSYNEFLGILDNEEFRMHLEKLDMKEIYNDDRFMEAREVSDRFQGALTNIFIKEDSNIQKFTLRYGIF